MTDIGSKNNGAHYQYKNASEGNCVEGKLISKVFISRVECSRYKHDDIWTGYSKQLCDYYCHVV